MANSYKALEKENLILREYIIRLQSNLLEVQSEIPPAPPELRKQSVSLGSMMPPPMPTHSNDLEESLRGSPDSEMDLNHQLQDINFKRRRRQQQGRLELGMSAEMGRIRNSER
jgi:hypothetical protein